MLRVDNYLANGPRQSVDGADSPVNSGHSPFLRSRRQSWAAHTRSCLLWGLAFFAAAHVGMLIATQSFWPHLRDPEFGYKLSALCRQRAQEPNRPLLVLLGSSRTGVGVRPDVMPELRTPDGRIAFVFNFSQLGSGPLGELVTLHRLLDAGIRPDWLAVEILPALLGRKTDAFGDGPVGISRLSWSDVRLLRHYVYDPHTMKHNWYQDQLAPWYAQRLSVLNHYASALLPWRLRLNHWKQLDRWGWLDTGADNQTLATVPAALKVTRLSYYDDLQNLRISSMQDHALGDLISLCRQEGIPLLFYIMPEGDMFRGWYAPSVRSRLNDYLTRLSRQTGVPIVDLRTWMTERYFRDSNHLYRMGAKLFSRRFAQEVLGYFVQGQPGSCPSLLATTTLQRSENKN
jgi:hypothetical protein